MTVVAALGFYGEHHAPHLAAPDRIAYAIQALIPFWRGVLVQDVNAAACRRYAAERTTATGAYAAQRAVQRSTARHELSILRSALRWCHREGYLTYAPPVTLPQGNKPRDRWLTRDEVAWLLRAARQTPHLQRFILIAVKTGTRSKAILDLEWRPSLENGWIDTDSGVLHRSGARARQTKKRKPPTRMPRSLLAHCRRWQRDGARFVIHQRNCQTGSVQTAWRNMLQRAQELAAAANRPIDLTGVTPHTLKHTAVTWAMHRGVPLADAAGFFGTTAAELERTYLHHHPDFMKATAAAMDRKA